MATEKVQHKAVLAFIRACLNDRYKRKQYDRAEIAEYWRQAQADFLWAKQFAALLHVQNLALQESEDRKGNDSNRGAQAGKYSRMVRGRAR